MNTGTSSQYGDPHDDAAELRQEVGALRRQLAEANAALDAWQATGDAIMLAVCGRVAPLSDSDVIGVVADLRAEVAALQQRLFEVDDPLDYTALCAQLYAGG